MNESRFAVAIIHFRYTSLHYSYLYTHIKLHSKIRFGIASCYYLPSKVVSSKESSQHTLWRVYGRVFRQGVQVPNILEFYIDVTTATSSPATCLWSGPWSRRMSPWASWWGGWSGSAPGSRWPPPCSCSLEMERSSLYHHNSMIISPHPAPPWWPRSPCPCQSPRSSRSCCWDHMGSSPSAALLD